MKHFLIILQSLVMIAHLAAYDLYSSQATIRHIEGKGIGYQRGYTTLDLDFFTASGDLYPLINIRGHGFDDLKLAASVGVGLRVLTDSPWIFGTNLYYDVRQGSHHFLNQTGTTYQQLGFGFEALGPSFDFRLNFNIPFGDKEKKFIQTRFEDGRGIVPIITHIRESTMEGTDFEVGTFAASGNLCSYRWNLYTAGGAYYLSPHRGKNRLGGKARIHATIARYFFCEAKGYYDPVDRGIGQLTMGIEFPLFPWASEKSRYDHCEGDYSPYWPTFREMVTQPIIRTEIIPLSHH